MIYVEFSRPKWKVQAVLACLHKSFCHFAFNHTDEHEFIGVSRRLLVRFILAWLTFDLLQIFNNVRPTMINLNVPNLGTFPFPLLISSNCQSTNSQEETLHNNNKTFKKKKNSSTLRCKNRKYSETSRALQARNHARRKRLIATHFSSASKSQVRREYSKWFISMRAAWFNDPPQFILC